MSLNADPWPPRRIVPVSLGNKEAGSVPRSGVISAARSAQDRPESNARDKTFASFSPKALRDGRTFIPDGREKNVVRQGIEPPPSQRRLIYSPPPVMSAFHAVVGRITWIPSHAVKGVRRLRESANRSRARSRSDAHTRRAPRRPAGWTSENSSTWRGTTISVDLRGQEESYQ